MSDDTSTIDEKLNPQVQRLSVGARTVREINIYPLSVGDELEFVKVIGKGIQDYLKASAKPMEEREAHAIKVISDIVEAQLPVLLKYVTDDAELKDFTNEQLFELAGIILDNNFGTLVKNAQSLSERVKKTFLWERLSQSFANSTVDTVLNTSIDAPSETEESPEAK